MMMMGEFRLKMGGTELSIVSICYFSLTILLPAV